MAVSPDFATPTFQQVLERLRRNGECLTPDLDDVNRRRYPLIVRASVRVPAITSREMREESWLVERGHEG